jgi:predicted metal-dependent hydrolase
MKYRTSRGPAINQPFKEKVHIWAKKIRVKPKQVRLQKKMTRKWASCSTRGWVTFSEDLTRESEAFQDMVIVHELLHLKVPNHGKLFKSLLSAHVPGWRNVVLHRNNISSKNQFA